MTTQPSKRSTPSGGPDAERAARLAGRAAERLAIAQTAGALAVADLEANGVPVVFAADGKVWQRRGAAPPVALRDLPATPFSATKREK